MNESLPPNHYKPLLTDDFVACPLHRMEMVQLSDPAIHVFTDFTHNRPAMISSTASIDAAVNRMKHAGEHVLLVVDEVDKDATTGSQSGRVVGQVTSCDIMGDVPINVARENGMHHDEVPVKLVMTPREDIQVLDWSIARGVKVGHILATMQDRECCHILVVEDGELRGMFSRSEINKHLEHTDVEPMVCAHSLAELVHRVG